MNPREELSAKLSEEFGLGTVSTATRIEREIIKPYAIGRWVPVEERLPENGVRCVVKGHDDNLFCADHFCNGIWDKYPHEPTVTHWLDLALPIGEKEA